MDRDRPHLPRPAPIDAYGDGGFRFAGMSHRGSLLCRPDGIWAVEIRSTDDLTPDRLQTTLAQVPQVDIFLIGTGAKPWPVPDATRTLFRARAMSVDAMTTGAAVRTYNVLLAENRRVAALLIAVD